MKVRGGRGHAMMTSFFQRGLSRDEAGGEGKKWRFLDDVICERTLITWYCLVHR